MSLKNHHIQSSLLYAKKVEALWCQAPWWTRSWKEDGGTQNNQLRLLNPLFLRTKLDVQVFKELGLGFPIQVTCSHTAAMGKWLFFKKLKRTQPIWAQNATVGEGKTPASLLPVILLHWNGAFFIFAVLHETFYAQWRKKMGKQLLPALFKCRKMASEGALLSPIVVFWAQTGF